MSAPLHQLEQRLEYSFRDPALMLQAVTHPSYLHEAKASGCRDYQRLEFLGDAILGLLLAEMLFDHYPEWHEGELSQLRSRLAGQDVLAERARSLDIGDYILLGRGEQLTAGRDKDSIIADVLEALIAAMYLDSGMEASRALIQRLFDRLMTSPEQLVLGRDAKSELQELLSLHGFPQPEYRLLEESGPPHERRFCFQVLVNDKIFGMGEGKSKKAAQQSAAVEAIASVRRALDN